MARKKELIEENIQLDAIEDNDQHIKSIAELESEKLKHIQVYKKGQRVFINGIGNSRYDGCGYEVKAHDIRGVKAYIPGAVFEYEICNDKNKVIGYFKEYNLEER